MRLTYLGVLLGFGVLGYWGHDLPELNLPTTAIQDSSTVSIPAASTASASTASVVSQSKASLSDSVISDRVIKLSLSLAKRSRYIDAITLLQSIPPEDKNFAKAQQLQNQSGAAILALGKAKLKQGRISEGRAILRSVPSATQAHPEAVKVLNNLSRSN